jgi:triphosphoribosyl-dephospho-CoA synthase
MGAEGDEMKVPQTCPVAEAYRLACDWEVCARKAGNVHLEAAFADMSADDFHASSAVTAPVVAQAVRRGVGPTILAAVRRRRRVTPVNTNLGILLLCVPLAAVPSSSGGGARWLRQGVGRVLRRLSVADADAAYRAIRLANPGGLGRTSRADVRSRPRIRLLTAMRLAASRDSIARQYANGFADVFNVGLPALRRGRRLGWPLEDAILFCQLRFLAQLGDSLIARKCGPALSRQVRKQATAILAAGWPDSSCSWRLWTEFDLWLRADGHRRNPGATADLVTASLFAALRVGLLSPAAAECFRSRRFLISWP